MSTVPVVVIPIYNAPDEAIACLESVLRHTPTDVRILLIDDHGPERRFFDHLERVRPTIAHPIEVIRPEANLGFGGACNLAFGLTSPDDVILVNSDVVVGPEWYERMVAAATSSSDIATVSVFTNNGTILSLPHRNSPCTDIVGGWTVDEAAKRVAATSHLLRPIIPTSVGHCLLVTRRAINLVGGFDPVFGTGYGEEVDFSQRCIRLGLRDIVADDVFVFHKGSSSFTDAVIPQRRANEALVDSRYPWYSGSVQRAKSDPYSSLATAINRASLQLRSPSIAFDGHCFASTWAGTQQMTFELIQAVALNRPAQEFTVVFSTHASDELIAKVTEQPNVHAEIVPNIMEDHAFRFDLLVRPHQVNSTEELRWMKRVANRTIVAQLDFISFSNPTYFGDDHSWLSQRELTRLVHSSVDGVAWISEYVARDAIRSGIQTRGASKVVFNGTDPRRTSVKLRRPDALPEDPGPIVTVLGVGYRHKNRPFALEVLGRLVAEGNACHFVLAGPQPHHGSSLPEEKSILEGRPAVAARVTLIESLDDDERDWLYQNSVAILYPTVSEGFGLVPFEAARFGTPTIASRMGSLDEVLPHDIPTIIDFDIDDTTRLVRDVIASDSVRRDIVTAILRRADEFTWGRTASLMLELVDDVLSGPRNNIDSIWAEAPTAATIHTADYVARVRRTNRKSTLYRLVTSIGLGRLLVGPGGSRRRRALKALYRRIER